MNPYRHTLPSWMAAALVLACGASAVAAQVSAQPRGNYQRVSFTFDSPATLKVDSAGNKIVLHFTQPLDQSPATIQNALNGYATDVDLSPDGKTVTITTAKPYRTRNFVSGNMVGLDLIGKPDPQAAAKAEDKAAIEEATANPIMNTQKAAPTPQVTEKTITPKPAAKPIAEKAAPAPKPEAAIAAPAKKPAAEEMLTTKHEEPAPRTEPVKAPAAKPAAEEMLSTKHEAAAPAQPTMAVDKTDAMLTTKKEPETAKAEPAPAAAPTPAPAKQEDAMLTTKHEEPAPAPAPVVEKPAAPAAEPPAAAATTPAKTEQAPVPAPEATAAPAAKPTGQFAVKTKTVGKNTVITFPFSERTAAAVYERGNDIWIVFSRPADANAAQLSTALPKAFREVKQYNYPGHTILHLLGNGNMHAGAKANAGGYGWDITLSPLPTVPSLDTPVSIDTDDGKNRVLLGAFDVDPAISFYDPNVGDLVLVLPSYESGRGVAHGRNYPEFSLLESAQGVVIASAREDLETHISRLGITIETPKGLAVTKNLGILNTKGAPVAGLHSSDVMLSYEQWRVAPEKFKETLLERQTALNHSSAEKRGDNLLALATLYLGQGLGTEAYGYLDLIQNNEPEFYKEHKLALLTAAAQALRNRPQEASEALKAPEIADLPEAELWRDYLQMLTFTPMANEAQVPEATAPAAAKESVPTPAAETAPAPAPAKETAPAAEAPPASTPAAPAAETAPAAPAKEGATAETAPPVPAVTEDPAKHAPTPVIVPRPQMPTMEFLKYNTPYIRFYPPKIRQMLASAAADAYLANGLEEKAVAVFETLNQDNILGPLKRHSEFAVAMASIKERKLKQALELFKLLETQTDDPEIRARAYFEQAMLELQEARKKPLEVADEIEKARLIWRGGPLERMMLKTLAQIYLNERQYAETLRTWRTLNDAFPDDPDYLTISGQMADLFAKLYLEGAADELTPLTSLSLFYEFRDLTPIGEKGDLIIQHLADRLAAFDLIDRATQLLENQIAYRLSGEQRSRVGARLALLYLLNKQPAEALKVIEVTNFGGNVPELQRQRQELTAQALSNLSRFEEALSVLYNDHSAEGELLKLDVLWAAHDWPNVVNQAEAILAKRTDLTAKLTPVETEVLLKLALGYSFEGDYTQLRYLRDYYSNLLPDTAYKQIFDFITNDTAPIDRDDATLLTEQIKHTESFLDTFKTKIAQGKLSETIK